MLLLRSMLSIFLICHVKGLPIDIEKREGQSQPFWISMFACVGIMISVILLAIVIASCIKVKKRRRQTLVVSEEQAPGRTEGEKPKTQVHGEECRSVPPPTEAVSATTKHDDTPKPKKQSKKKSTGGTWSSNAFASIGRKSVASVQWVSFRGSMDRKPQSEQLFVVNNNDHDKAIRGS